MATSASQLKGDARLAGLSLVPADPGRAARAIGASILGVTAFILLLDAAFRSSLEPGYVQFFTGPLWPRTGLVESRAAVEEVQFRLLLMSALVLLGSLRNGRAPGWWIVAAILLSQFANVGTLVISDPLYASLRYWAVGCVWGWLYWKHGWLSALLGHTATHLILDPALLVLLSH